MKLAASLTFVFAALAAATSVVVKYDTTYDTASLSTLVIACSDGENGLYTMGYPTLGSLPNFPNIGAASVVTGWNSPQCGKCFKLTYKSKVVYVTAVDVASGGTGFVLSKAAMNTLTGGQAVALGRVTADSVPVASSFCHM